MTKDTLRCRICGSRWGACPSLEAATPPDHWCLQLAGALKKQVAQAIPDTVAEFLDAALRSRPTPMARNLGEIARIARKSALRTN